MLTADWARQKSPEIPLDPKSGDGEEYSCDPDQQSEEIDEKGIRCFPEPVYRAEHCSVCIQKRADPGERYDKAAGGLAVEKKTADKRSEQKEKETAGQAEDEAAPGRFSDQADNIRTFSGCLLFCDCGHQHRSDGIGYGGRKKDARQSHSGEYAVENERLARTVRIDSETRRDRCGFNALQKGDSRAVCSKRK